MWRTSNAHLFRNFKLCGRSHKACGWDTFTFVSSPWKGWKSCKAARFRCVRGLGRDLLSLWVNLSSAHSRTQTRTPYVSWNAETCGGSFTCLCLRRQGVPEDLDQIGWSTHEKSYSMYADFLLRVVGARKCGCDWDSLMFSLRRRVWGNNIFKWIWSC